jgi:lipopolysaccharide biosynthesis protein
LERPFNEVLASGEPDFPFCLAWANETWSRRWLGEERDILQKQTYSVEDDYNHIRWLITAFADPRYIKVNGRPLFLIYRPLDLPDARRTAEIFRSECIKRGIAEPYLLGMDAHRLNLDCKDLGFDGTVKFEPQLGVLPGFKSDAMKLGKLKGNLKFGVLSSTLKIYDYAEARQLLKKRSNGVAAYPCIFVGWDNTPRRGRNGIIIVGATPEVFESHLREIVQSVSAKPFEERLVFINAWNEWAEGNHLEPDEQNGLRHLEAIKRINLL